MVICLYGLCYLSLQFTTTGHSGHHLILGILLYCFQTTFDLCGSHYPYLEACHFLTSLRIWPVQCSNPCWAELSESKYWLENSTIPHGIFSKPICEALCRIYYGYWHWFVYTCICWDNISSILSSYTDSEAAVTHPSTDSDLLVYSQSSAETHVDSKGKGRWLKRLWEPVFQRKPRGSIFLPKLRDD